MGGALSYYYDYDMGGDSIPGCSSKVFSLLLVFPSYVLTPFCSHKHIPVHPALHFPSQILGLGGNSRKDRRLPSLIKVL